MTENHMQERGNAIGMLLTGIAVGAVLGASAVVLSDEKKRKKIMEKVDQARVKAAKMMEKARLRTNEMKSHVSESMNDAQETAAEKLEEGERTPRRHRE